jgi:hypothetical protein
MVLYIPSVIFMTRVFTWIFDNTEGSILDRCGAISSHCCGRVAGLNDRQRQQLSAVPVALRDGLASEYEDACPSLR